MPRLRSIPSLFLFAALALQAAQAQTPGPTPPSIDHRRIIAENVPRLFAADAQARDIAVSELRRVTSPVGLTWGACVRVNATSIGGQPTATRTYVVLFSRDLIAERRIAAGEDCTGAKFDPVKVR